MASPLMTIVDKNYIRLIRYLGFYMTGESTTIAISKKNRERITLEVIHPKEKETGTCFSFDNAIKELLNNYHP